MRSTRTGIMLACACLFVGACSTSSLTRSISNSTAEASIVDAMQGGLIGGDLGKGLAERDKRRGLQAEYQALEHTAGGKAVTWKSDGERYAGEVVAAQPYRVGSQDCRQYSHKLFDGGRQLEARGTACRNADGSWTPLT